MPPASSTATSSPRRPARRLALSALEPEQAEDGLQAVEMASRAAYDLILMDVHMPVMEGIEATRRIHAIDRYRDTPIIAVTADAFTADRQRVSTPA